MWRGDEGRKDADAGRGGAGEVALGARLDDDLFELMQVDEARNALRAVILETYFSSDARTELIAQTTLNIQAFVYSQELVENARRQIRESHVVKREYLQQVRDQGFRKAIVRIYQHRCAFCGVRLITVDGHSAVEAAHIVPWSIHHNDDLHNGIALCRLCHWTFDEGLLAISAKYIVVVSRELRIDSNLPVHLLTLEGRPIIAPEETTLHPDLESLTWHRQNVFRNI